VNGPVREENGSYHRRLAGIETQLQACTGLGEEASKSFAAHESLCKELLKSANVGQAAAEGEHHSV
jgi:hypothetical protein